MKWWMSYLAGPKQIGFSTCVAGHCVYASDEHPIEKIKRWQETYGKQDGKNYVLVAFQQVSDETPEIDSECYFGPLT